MHDTFEAKEVKAASRIWPWALAAAALLPGGLVIGLGVLIVRAVKRVRGGKR